MADKTALQEYDEALDDFVITERIARDEMYNALRRLESAATHWNRLKRIISHAMDEVPENHERAGELIEAFGMTQGVVVNLDEARRKTAAAIKVRME